MLHLPCRGVGSVSCWLTLLVRLAAAECKKANLCWCLADACMTLRNNAWEKRIDDWVVVERGQPRSGSREESG